MFWQQPLVHLLVISVVAALATIMLFKWLGSQAFVKKKERGLTVVLTGAAAGFALIGAGLYYVDVQLLKLLPATPPAVIGSSLLTVRGSIEFPDGSPTNEGILFTFEPPNQTVERDGEFIIENVPVLRDLTTRIHALKDGREFDVIVLDDRHIRRDTAEADTNAYELRSPLVCKEPAPAAAATGYDSGAGTPTVIGE